MSEAVKQAIELLKKRLPQAEVRVDEPLLQAGFWHVDVTLGLNGATLEWHPKKGFGVCRDMNPGLGEGPDEVYPEMGPAVDRIVHLVETGL